ncbi:MAG: hypothetical protein GXP36_08260 [Actinobacteria bacterium]|nr:hypothetical protein [Actinomycetota bacterium]
MDLTTFQDELAIWFQTPRLESEDLVVLLPDAPVDIAAVAYDTLDDLEEEEAAYRVIGEQEGLRPLVTFEWDERGTEPWRFAIEMLPIDNRIYLTTPPDGAIEQAWEAFAVCTEGSNDLYAAVFVDLAMENGEPYGIDLFSSLPTTIWSDILNREVVFASFFRYLDWDESRSPGAWKAAAADLPPVMSDNESVAGAAAAVLKDDNPTNRVVFLATWIAHAYKPTRPT